MSTGVKFFSTQEQDREIDALAAMKRVLDRRHYVLGEEVTRFQQEFAAYLGTEFCTGVGNGTDALEIALRALGVQAGDEVVCAANAGFYAPTAIHAVGARPFYADVDPATMTMSASHLEACLAGRRPKAVIVTHLYGQSADVPALLALCRPQGIALIEDCAQAHGAMVGGRKVGTLGDVGCFSFYPTKNLGALGDGGAVVTSDAALHSRLQMLRQYGWGQKYHVDMAGGRNSRLDELQAAVLREKLPLLDRWNAARRRIATRYSEAFQDLPLTLPPSLGTDYVAHLYVVRTTRRDALKAHLAAEGIACDVHYPVPCHLQQAYRAHAQDQHAGLAECVAACGQVLTLPCYPGMPDADIGTVTASVRRFFEGLPA